MRDKDGMVIRWAMGEGAGAGKSERNGITWERPREGRAR